MRFRLDRGRVAALGVLLGCALWVRAGDTQSSPPADPAARAFCDSVAIRDALASDQPASADLLAYIADPSIAPPCQAAIVEHLIQARVRFEGKPEGRLLAAALLERADAGTDGDLDLRYRLELGAACLWADDGLIKRMMAHCRSGVAPRMEQGIAMLGMAHDPRAGDSLLAYIRALTSTGAHPLVLGKTLQIAAQRLGPGAYHSAEEVFRLTPNASLRRAALLALCRTQDPRAHAVLLGAYADSTSGIADSTHESGERLEFYRDLWLMTRLVEESLIRVLREGTAGEGETAVELADRASRFGPPALPEDFYPALDAWGERAGAAARERVRAIVERCRAHPDRPRPQDAEGFPLESFRGRW